MEMKKKFLNELNYKLRLLKREERIKCLNNYQEIIADKIETGMSESDVIADLGSAKQVAQDILASYAEMEERVIDRKLRVVNKMYLIVDLIILLVAYMVSCFICYQSSIAQDGQWTFPILQYASVLLLLIPCYLLLYYVFRLYETSYVRRPWKEAWNILLVNIIGLMLFAVVLYFTSNYNFPRRMLFDFFLVNTAMDIAIRRFVLSGSSWLCLTSK
jgi:hypothetical protein